MPAGKIELVPRGKKIEVKRPRKRGRTKRSKNFNSNANQKQTIQTRMFPVVKKCIMKYDDIYELYHVTGVPQVQVVRANSLFDPDYTNGSGLNIQPIGFDQVMGVYNQYLVYACTAYCSATSLDRTYGSYVIAYPTLQPVPSASTKAELHHLASQPLARRIFLPPDGKPVKFKIHFSCKNRFGVMMEDLIAEQGTYGGDSGSNPSRIGYINFITYKGDNSVASAAVTTHIDVKLRYKCIFRQKSEIPADS